MTDPLVEVAVIRDAVVLLSPLTRSERFRVLAYLVDREGLRSSSDNLYRWSASARGQEDVSEAEVEP